MFSKKLSQDLAAGMAPLKDLCLLCEAWGQKFSSKFFQSTAAAAETFFIFFEVLSSHTQVGTGLG